MKQRANNMDRKKGVTYESQVRDERKKNYRKVVMSRSYWEECGSPRLDDPLFLRAVFIGYGASAIRLLLLGFDGKSEDVYYTAEFMGFNEGSFEVKVKE